MMLKTKLLKAVFIVAVPILTVWLNLQFISSAHFMNWAYNLMATLNNNAVENTADPATRLRLAQESRSIFLSHQPSDYYSLTWPDGKTLYTDQEVMHLLDVERLYSKLDLVGWLTLFTVGLVIGTILVLNQLSDVFGWKNLPIEVIRSGLKTGSILTLILTTTTMIFMLLAWSRFFLIFHEALFPPDTWSFPANYGLIQLFPELFWQIVGGTMTLGTIFVAGLIWFATSLSWSFRRKSKLETSTKTQPKSSV